MLKFDENYKSTDPRTLKKTKIKTMNKTASKHNVIEWLKISEKENYKRKSFSPPAPGTLHRETMIEVTA